MVPLASSATPNPAIVMTGTSFSGVMVMVIDAAEEHCPASAAPTQALKESITASVESCAGV